MEYLELPRIPPLELPLLKPNVDQRWRREPGWHWGQEIEKWGRDLSKDLPKGARRDAIPGRPSSIAWSPVYDTQVIGSDGGPYLFFQHPGTRGPEETNVTTAGSMPFPEALSGRGIVLQSDQPLPYAYQVQLMVGEISYHTSYITRAPSLKDIREGDDGRSHYLYTEPFYVPPVQNFNVLIRWNGYPSHVAVQKQHLRVTLMTWRLQEVQ
jgi:hypothetical protein